jgi:hypothetical protein
MHWPAMQCMQHLSICLTKPTITILSTNLTDLKHFTISLL